MKLANKIALITGAGSGMGRAASLLFAAEGATVACVDVNMDAAEETARTIEGARGRALGIHADVSRTDDVKAMVDTTVAKLGVPNILYNNAGIEGKSAFLALMAEDDFDRVIAINLRGVWLGMKHVLPHMIKNGGGSVINTASVAGLVGIKGAAAYCAAKAGVISLTRVAALEYGRYNIRVNAICPGAIDTPMVRRVQSGGALPERALTGVSVMNRVGQAEEIAKTALFLASDESSFATGAPFIIDGGWTVS